MRSRRIAAVLAGASALALVLASCGGSSSPTSTTTSAAGAAQSILSEAQSVGSEARSAASSAVASVRGDASAALSSAQSQISAALSAATADSQVLTKAKEGNLVIGIKFDQPGLGQQNPDGSVSGFDVEVAEYVADKLGVEPGNIEWKEAKSAEREGLIERGEVDYIVATYSITDSRAEQVNFAGPYFVAEQDLLVKADNTDITGPEAMTGKILCSVSGSTSAQKVKDDYAADVALQEYGTYTECVEALRAGAVDAVTTDNVILAGYAAQYPGELKVVGKGFSTENYGIGLKKGDEAGTAAINAALVAMIADGSWERALQDTVGPSGFEIPAPPTPGVKA